MPTLTTIADLCGASAKEPWHVHMIAAEIGGGKLAPSDLSGIEQKPAASVLTISGLDQRTFECLVRDYGSRFVGIHFWKCPRIEDLTPLEDLSGLTHVAFYWNQRASRLWNFARTPQLRGLSFRDFTQLHDLGDLSTASSVSELVFGDAIWSKSTFHSLSPLARMTGLKTLEFDAKRIDDGKIQPLAALSHLETLEFAPNQFTTQQVAWLRARLPATVTSSVLQAYKLFANATAFDAGAKVRDVLVIGKRKPWLNSTADADRIQRYVAEFSRLVERYRNDPGMDPDE